MNNLNLWNETKVKEEIVSFVKRVTSPNSPDYIPPEERVAVFDNDGTLWCEKPMPIQADFLFQRLAEMVEKDPELKDQQPWKSIVEKDYPWLTHVLDKHYQGDDSDLKIMSRGLLQAYEGISVDDFSAKASNFIRNEKNPKLGRPYMECIYQPMVELLEFLEMNGFTNYIASAGGRDFVRTVSEELYHIPPERIIGTSATLAFCEDGEHVRINHKLGLDVFDDGPEKPVRIWNRIGRRPILCVGNSNGDIPMLRFCSDSSSPSFCMLINHDDSKREMAYTSGAELALEKAKQYGWSVVNMQKDWKVVFESPTINNELRNAA